MNKIKAFTIKHPFIFIIIISLLSIILTELPLQNFFGNYIDKQSASYLTGFLEQTIWSLFLIALIAGLGLLKNSGFTKPNEWKQLWLVWPILVYSILNGWSLFSGEIIIDTSVPYRIILFLLTYMSTGLFEETLCRSINTVLIIRKLGNTRKGIYLSVILSSAIFGLFHFINFIMGRSTLLTVVTQIVYAIYFGVFFSACMLRNHTIFPAMITHAVFDICGNFNDIAVGGNFFKVNETTLSESIITMLILLPLLIYGLFILRKVKPENILE